MKTRERSFEAGAIIFREGEAGDSVFVVESGRVELLKNGPDGMPVQIALVGPSELLGEMGAVDSLPHGATARTLEPSRLRAIPRAEFKTWLQQEPEAAARVMAVLVERLRAADSVMAGQKPQPASAAAAPGPAKPGERGVSLITAIASWLLARRAKPDPAVTQQGESTFKIGLAALNNDVDAAWTRALAGTIETRQGVSVRVLETSVAAPAGDDQNQVMASASRGRQVLHDVGGELDLLIWGDVHEQGFSLWFTLAGGGTADEDRPGTFGPYLHLDLPPELDPPLGDILYVSVLAAIEPVDEEAAMRQRRLLPVALDTMDDPLKSLPPAWGPARARTALTCWGHACATRAGIDGDIRWYERAQAAYRAALQRLPRNEHGIDEAQLRRHLGGVLMALGEKRQDHGLLQAAVTEFKMAVDCLVKGVHPLEWGGGQNRLGLALYRLDLLMGRSDLLKDALAAFQAACTVYTRATEPARWSEVMNNMSQVMQVFGDQMKNPEVLSRAVEAARSSFDLQNRERDPLAWAASRNSLGSALFLLDKHRGTAEHLEEAAAYFSASLNMYRALGAARPAGVAEKNLARATQLIKERGARKLAKPDWAEEEKG